MHIKHTSGIGATNENASTEEQIEPTFEYAEASTFSNDETASATEAEVPERIF